MSKNFKEHEVIGYLMVDGRKTVYLKMGVKRNYKYNDHLDDNEMDHINKSLVILSRYTEYLKKVVGLDDFDNN